MTWTRDLPTVIGFYWLRSVGASGSGHPVEVVEVGGTDPYPHVMLYQIGDTDKLYAGNEDQSREWYGPIRPPE